MTVRSTLRNTSLLFFCSTGAYFIYLLLLRLAVGLILSGEQQTESVPARLIMAAALDLGKGIALFLPVWITAPRLSLSPRVAAPLIVLALFAWEAGVNAILDQSIWLSAPAQAIAIRSVIVLLLIFVSYLLIRHRQAQSAHQRTQSISQD